MICGFFVIKCILVFFYVENFVEIPSEWKDRLRSICPHMKKVDFLHNQGPAYAGYYFVLPFAYLWNTLEHSSYSKLFFPRVSHLSDRKGVFEIVTRLVIVVWLDQLVSSHLPFMLFQTKDLDLHQDFAVKRMLASFLFTLSANGPLEHYLRLVFRYPCPDKMRTLAN
jgi:hypothetical protein